MPTCRSWRYNSSSGNIDALPGTDRIAWSLCHNKVPRGIRRCEECLNALLFHPNPQIRESLAKEKDVSRSTLEYLSESDPSMAVVAEADKALAKLDKSPRRNAKAETPLPKSAKQRRTGSALWGNDSETLGVNALGEKVEGGEEEFIAPRADAFDAVLEQPADTKKTKRSKK